MALAVFADLNRQSKVDEHLESQAKWAIQYCYAKAQAAMLGFIREYPNRFIAALLRIIIAPFGQTFHVPDDASDKKLAHLMSSDHPYRQRLLAMIYLSGDKHQPIDRVEQAFEQITSIGHLYEKMPEIRKLKFLHLSAFLDEYVSKGKLTEAEKASILMAESARYDALLVDEFILKEEKHPTYVEV